LIATRLILELAFLSEGNEALTVIISLFYEQLLPGLEFGSRDYIVYAEGETIVSWLVKISR